MTASSKQNLIDEKKKIFGKIAVKKYGKNNQANIKKVWDYVRATAQQKDIDENSRIIELCDKYDLSKRKFKKLIDIPPIATTIIKPSPLKKKKETKLEFFIRTTKESIPSAVISTVIGMILAAIITMVLQYFFN